MNEVRTYKYYAGAEWRAATSGRTFDVHEPFSGQLYAKVAAGGAADARIAVQAAADAFPAWSQTTPAERASLFLKVGEIVKRRRTESAEVLARETGGTISFATFQQDLVAANLQEAAGRVSLPKGEVLQTNQPGVHSIAHSSGMLVGYVPDARVLFTADLVSDTFPLIPVFASPVHELIQEKGLSVEMIASGHGNVMPYAQLAYVLGK
jgi:acyl-CoA reductase-like NAD-dependent aldehyde dehydrogenase